MGAVYWAIVPCPIGNSSMQVLAYILSEKDKKGRFPSVCLFWGHIESKGS